MKWNEIKLKLNFKKLLLELFWLLKYIIKKTMGKKSCIYFFVLFRVPTIM